MYVYNARTRVYGNLRVRTGGGAYVPGDKEASVRTFVQTNVPATGHK